MHRFLLPIILIAVLVEPAILAAQPAPLDETPAIVGQLGMTNIEVYRKKRDHHGQRIHGTLPDGTGIEIDLDRKGSVEEVEADGKTGFPAKAIETLVPAAVRANPSYPADALLQKIELHDGHRVEIEGKRADGHKFKAEFSAEGRLLELKNHD